MKIKTLSATSAVLALLMANSAANAATLRAAGNHNFSGVVSAVVGGVSMSCNTTITINVPEANVDSPPLTGSFSHPLGTDNSHGHTGNITNMVLTGGPLGACATARFASGGPITVSGGVMQISSVVVNGPFGVTCSGPINAPITAQSHGPGTTITFTGAALGPCTFSGSLTSSTLDIDGSGRAGDPYAGAADGHKWP